jgi:hypothetical protein
MERVMRKELGRESEDDAEGRGAGDAAVDEADAREDEANAPETSGAANDANESSLLATPAPVVDANDTVEARSMRDHENDEDDYVARDDDDEDPPRPVTPVDDTERRARVAARTEELAKTKRQLDVTAWSLVAAILAILVKRVIVRSIIVALES